MEAITEAKAKQVSAKDIADEVMFKTRCMKFYADVVMDRVNQVHDDKSRDGLHQLQSDVDAMVHAMKRELDDVFKAMNTLFRLP